MNKMMLNLSDVVFATLEAGGRVIASVCTRNFSSIDDVVKAMRTAAGSFIGLARLTIRNKTQGWNVQMSLAMARRPLAQIAV